MLLRLFFFFFSSRRRHTRCALVTGVQTCALPISLPPEERFQASLKLAELPRNSAKIRLRNRCQLTGRSRAVYRKFRLSRIAMRELGSIGQIPGLVKSSWQEETGDGYERSPRRFADQYTQWITERACEGARAGAETAGQ